MKRGTQAVHLLLECVRSGAENENASHSGAAGPVSLEPLVIKRGVNYLAQERGKRPRLISRAPKIKESLFTLQQVTQNGVPCLLLLSPGERQAWVNGTVAASITLLSDRDEVLFDKHGEFLVHVAVFNQIYIGPPSVEEVGRDCRFCRTAFLPDSRVYVCPSCGKALHLEGNEKPEEERLQCALLCSVCPTCEAPIFKTSGYRSLPEFCKPRPDRNRS